jgi:hypothetical protein
MTFFLVQPYVSGPQRGRHATIVSAHNGLEAAYTALETIAQRLENQGLPSNAIQLLVVDEDRREVSGPGLH